MNSAHDVGGMHGFGPVPREQDEPLFHADWERRVFATTVLTRMQGLQGSLDATRHARERMGNVAYLSSSYYEIWLAGTLTRLAENGVVSQAELDARVDALRADAEAFPPPEPGGADALAQLVESRIPFGASPQRPVDEPPRFAAGDEVSTARRSRSWHTRLPRYARGRRGTVVRHHGAHVLPDASAHGLGERPEHLYTVRFAAGELWGDGADGPGSVHLDLWESYLDPATSID